MQIDPQYIAGLIDGDGSISIRKTHRSRKNCNYTAMIQISWRKGRAASYILNQIVKQYGGKVYNTKTSGSFRNRKNVITLKYSITGYKCFLLLKQILPYLIIKKDKAYCAIKNEIIVKNKNHLKYKYIQELLYKKNKIHKLVSLINKGNI